MIKNNSNIKIRDFLYLFRLHLFLFWLLYCSVYLMEINGVKMSKVLKVLATALVFASAGANASSSFGVDITEKARPGVPQARWTDVKITDNLFASSVTNFDYQISNYSVSFNWVTNEGAKGGCNIYYDVNKDSSTDFSDQTAKRRYNNTKEILSNLKVGDHLFIQSAFSTNSAPCEVTLKHNIGL